MAGRCPLVSPCKDGISCGAHGAAGSRIGVGNAKTVSLGDGRAHARIASVCFKKFGRFGSPGFAAISGQPLVTKSDPPRSCTQLGRWMDQSSSEVEGPTEFPRMCRRKGHCNSVLQGRPRSISTIHSATTLSWCVWASQSPFPFGRRRWPILPGNRVCQYDR